MPGLKENRSMTNKYIVKEKEVLEDKRIFISIKRKV